MKLTRRALLAALPMISCSSFDTDSRTAAQPGSFRLAVCNETFQNATFAEGCRMARKTGHTGLEIAPFTLSEDPASIAAGQRREYRDIMASEGIEYVGFHSLLTVPKDELHITTPDVQVRRRSWRFFRELVDLCADLRDGGIMVLGSGKQRDAINGSSIEDAERRMQEGLAEVAPHAAARGVVVLPETLAPHLSNVFTTLDRTVEMVKEIDSPAIQTIFDTHNAVAEKKPHDQLIKEHAPYIRHVHVNEMDGTHPGSGKYDFSVVLQALRDISYQHWVSLEVFKFLPSGEEVARASAEYLREVERNLRP